MNFKRRLLILFLTLFILPFNTFAINKYLVPGGENLGINIQSKGVLVVGFYETNNKRSYLQLGDIIVSINEVNVSSVNDMLKLIDTSSEKLTLSIGYLRNNILNNTTLNLVKDETGVFKTGL